MSWFDGLKHRLRPLWAPNDYQRDLDDEVRFHMEMDATHGHGVRHFGSPTKYREETRRMTVLGSLDVLRQDLRFGWRALRRSPAFTITAVLSLGLGIGANTAIFGLVYSVLLEPLPVPSPSELVVAQRRWENPQIPVLPEGQFTPAEFDRMRSAKSVRLSAYARGNGDIEMNGQKFGTSLQLVDGDYFGIVGVRPVAGRFITPDDDRKALPVAVIAELDWEKYWNRDPSAIGSTIKVEGVQFTVVGVTPRAYQGLTFPGDFWLAIPLGAGPQIDIVPATPGNGGLTVFGRLARGVRLGVADDELARVFGECCGTGELGIRGKDGAPAPAARSSLADISHGIVSQKADLRGQYRDLLLIMMSGVTVVLLIACANVGNLMFARATARAREMAVRLSLGATRTRLVRQLLTESAGLAVLGGALGLALAWMGTALLIRYLPGNLTVFTDVVTFHFKPSLLGFTAFVSIACILIFGLMPAWRAASTDLVTPLKDGGGARDGGRGWLRRSIVVAQVALALLLVTSAGLLGVTLRNLRHIDGGFATEHVLVATIDTRGTSFANNRGMTPIHAEILDRIRKVPGVVKAGMASFTPVYGGRSRLEEIDVPGYEPPDNVMPRSNWILATPSFLEASGIGVKLGRDFTDDDRGFESRVAIVSAEFVKRYFAGRSPIGATVALAAGRGGAPQIDATIVGVANDALMANLRGSIEPVVYFAAAQWQAWPFFSVVLRTSGDPNAVVDQARKAVAGFSPELKFFRAQAMEEAMDVALSRERLASGLAMVFAFIALSLAAVGLYGVVSYGVSRRTSEIAVRMALGARARDVVWHVLRGSLAMVAVGIGIGVPLALAGGRTVSALLFGVTSHDAGLFALAAIVLVAVATAASMIPAARAARVSPLIALRAS